MCILLMNAINVIRVKTVLRTGGTTRTDPNDVINTGSSDCMKLACLILPAMPTPTAVTGGPQMEEPMGKCSTHALRLQDYDTIPMDISRRDVAIPYSAGEPANMTGAMNVSACMGWQTVSAHRTCQNQEGDGLHGRGGGARGTTKQMLLPLLKPTGFPKGGLTCV